MLAPQRWRQVSSGNVGVRTLLFADLLPPLILPTLLSEGRGEGWLEKGFAEPGRGLSALPRVPRGQVGSGDGANVRGGSPLPKLAPHQGLRQRSLPTSLPPSQAMERKLGQAALSCCLVGGGGGRTAVSPRPAGPSLGIGWRRGLL